MSESVNPEEGKPVDPAVEPVETPGNPVAEPVETQGDALSQAEDILNGVEVPAEESVAKGAGEDAAELKNDLLRLQAEYVNYRKRVERDRAVAGQMAVIGVLNSLLPVLDDVDAGRAHGDIVDGPFAAIATKLETALGTYGLEKIDATGVPFDPLVHEAIQQVETAEHPAGTVVADDPRLDVRHVPTEVQPLRVLVDSRLRVPAAARMFEAPGSALVYCARAEPRIAAALRAQRVEVVERPNADGSVDLPSVLDDLAARGVNELHIEAGPTLNGALLQASLIDELLVYLAPKLIGSGRGMIEAAPLANLERAWGFQFDAAQRVGDDLRISARPPHALDWLD